MNYEVQQAGCRALKLFSGIGLDSNRVLKTELRKFSASRTEPVQLGAFLLESSLRKCFRLMTIAITRLGPEWYLRECSGSSGPLLVHSFANCPHTSGFSLLSWIYRSSKRTTPCGWLWTINLTVTGFGVQLHFCLKFTKILRSLTLLSTLWNRFFLNYSGSKEIKFSPYPPNKRVNKLTSNLSVLERSSQSTFTDEVSDHNPFFRSIVYYYIL